MATAVRKKACEACAAAKRRCGTETPYCSRCSRLGIRCTYPPTKPSCFVLCEGDEPFPVQHNSFPFKAIQFSTYSPAHPRLSLDLDLPELPNYFTDNLQASSWFNSPETWNIDRSLQVQYNVSHTVCLKHLIQRMHRWLAAWVEKGSNPFIHSRLYRSRFPQCVQDAYATLSCYIHKTAFSEHIVLQVIEDRAKQLLEKYSGPEVASLPDNTSTRVATLDPLEHIARVHALLVYQVLCLYDGDIRLRHIAENRIPVLNSWLEQMVAHASQEVCLGRSMVLPDYQQGALSLNQSCVTLCENVFWNSWILAESIRRTWLVASGIQGTYLVIQQGQPVPCLGGMMFTTRQGVWEAQSAVAWEKLCSEVNIGLMQVAETDKLFTEVAPEDVNDFTMLILQATYGEERMERWGVQAQD